MLKNTIYNDVKTAVLEVVNAGGLKKGDIFIVGCSTSEVLGGVIGKNGSLDVAESIVFALLDTLTPLGIGLAAQCCEHLNRAIVIEKSFAAQSEVVCAVPKIHAGGSFATMCYKKMQNPVLIESITANAGLDIGSTLIGMHLKRVAVPFRTSVKSIGNAYLTAAFTRPKYIGGERAEYK